MSKIQRLDRREKKNKRDKKPSIPTAPKRRNSMLPCFLGPVLQTHRRDQRSKITLCGSARNNRVARHAPARDISVPINNITRDSSSVVGFVARR